MNHDLVSMSFLLILGSISGCGGLRRAHNVFISLLAVFAVHTVGYDGQLARQMYELGCLYITGRGGVAQNDEEALRWWTKASKKV